VSLRPLQAAFFDMDGLIIDTETLDFRAWQETLAAHGYALRMEHWLSVVGTWGGFEGMYDAVGVPQDERQNIRDAKRERYMVMVRANLHPLPGFPALHADLRARNVPTAVVSTSSREWVDLILGEMGIADDFDFTLSGDDVENGKPAPDLYLLACERAQAEACACVVFEDSAHGVRAAVGAGIPAVAVPNGITSAQSFDHASARVASLEAVDSALLADLGLALPRVA
jgi:HAD superfamily hydrolase (TIGR01509 family)